jgi:hypothetical protein
MMSGRQQVMIEKNKGNTVCILLVVLTYILQATAQYLAAKSAHVSIYVLMLAIPSNCQGTKIT